MSGYASSLEIATVLTRKTIEHFQMLTSEISYHVFVFYEPQDTDFVVTDIYGPNNEALALAHKHSHYLGLNPAPHNTQP